MKVDKIFAFAIAAMLVSSCAPYVSKLQTDVVGFSDKVTKNYTRKSFFDGLLNPPRESYPYNLLRENSKEGMQSFVMKIPQGQNTAAYYAMDIGLDRVKYVRKNRRFMEKDPNSKYYIIMLTDGLDNVSTQVARNNRTFWQMLFGKNNYASGDAYAKALEKKMEKVMGSRPNAFQSYPIMFIGGDLKEIRDQNNMSSQDFHNFLVEKLKPFAGSRNAERPVPIAADDFNAIREDFLNQFRTNALEFVVPKDYAGKRIRMELTAYGDDDNTWIEGDFVKKGSSDFSFENIQYSPGLSGEVKAGSSIVALKEQNLDRKALTITFTIEKLSYIGKPYKVQSAQQKVKEGLIWTVNSEYDAVLASMKNAYIMVILDASSSFAENFQDAQKTILELVDYIAQ